MGTRSQAAQVGLADALFSPVQQRVLGLLFGQPQRRFQSAELIRLAGSGTGAVHRLVTRLASAGLITVTRTGNQKHYQANRACPVFPELQRLVVKTVGIVGPLRQALAPKARHIHASFVYGSLAKRTETARSDIDLMVISDTLTYPDLFRAIQSAERILARSVNPTVMTCPSGAPNGLSRAPSPPASREGPASSLWARTMTSPELENLVKIGQLKREPCSRAEFEGLLVSGEARLNDAANQTLAPESRFDLAYNAAHAVALAALRHRGYRSGNRYVVFQALPHTLGVPAPVWRVLAKCHERRNLAEYEGVLDVDERLLADLIEAARTVLAGVRALPRPA